MLKILSVKRLILVGLIFIAVFGIGCKYFIDNSQNLSSNQLLWLPVIFSLAMAFILFFLVSTWVIYYLIDNSVKRPIIRQGIKFILGAGNAVVIFITLCVLSILFSGQPFPNEELLNYYFDMPASDFKDVHVYYDERQKMLFVYFRFQMNGDAANKRMQKYIDKYCHKNAASLRKGFDTLQLKWWNPQVEKSDTFYSGGFRGKKVDLAKLYIDDGKTIYVMLMHVFSDTKTTQKKQ